MPENNLNPNVTPDAPNAPDSTPPPGAYMVGTVLGLKQVKPKSGGDALYFLRFDDGSDSHEMMIPKDEDLKYRTAQPGDKMIVPIRIGLREYQGKQQLSLMIRSAAK